VGIKNCSELFKRKCGGIMFCRPAEKKKMEKDFDKKMKRPIITEKLQATQLSRKRDDSSIETFFVGIFVFL
jgi:hypothetical protein